MKSLTFYVTKENDVSCMKIINLEVTGNINKVTSTGDAQWSPESLKTSNGSESVELISNNHTHANTVDNETVQALRTAGDRGCVWTSIKRYQNYFGRSGRFWRDSSFWRKQRASSYVQTTTKILWHLTTQCWWNSHNFTTVANEHQQKWRFLYCCLCSNVTFNFNIFNT